MTKILTIVLKFLKNEAVRKTAIELVAEVIATVISKTITGGESASAQYA